MRVTKEQAQASRARIVETASTLFRERGFDGVGVADLMGAAGLTHGGFYKHFQAKASLMAEATESGISQLVATASGMGVGHIFKFYLSREHRDALGGGCTFAALSGDAARQSEDIKATFAAGIEDVLATLESKSAELGKPGRREMRAKMIDTFAHALGAVVLSRACPDDSPLSDEILDVCRKKILASLASPAATTVSPKTRSPKRR